MATVDIFPGFDPELDCKKLRAAMKGAGTDEKAIISVLCYRSNDQRQELKLKYKSMYGEELVGNLTGELSGKFRKVMLGLMMTRAEYDAYSIKTAVKGLGTDEAALIEVLCSRENDELQAAKDAYNKKYGKTMEKAVATDVSGDFKRALVALIAARREPDGPVDQAKAAKDAKDLYNAGEGTWGTDESVFNTILVSKSYSHLRAVYSEYQKLSKHSIETAIKKEMSGDLEKTYLAIISCSKDPCSFFVERLYKSMKGLGTDEDTLTRVVVSRCEIDLVQIKEAFMKAYGKSLSSFIKDDTSGYYERALQALCR